MNEKIKQLAEQATRNVESANSYHSLVFDKEKFAELIIQECVGIVEDYGLSLVDRDENYLGETLNLSIRVQEAGNKIKEHFGVEE
jgi:hypothetical protein